MKRMDPEGLVVIGNHYPEYKAEESLDNLTQAVAELEIVYPVVQDNQGWNWGVYQVHYWPTLFLIDKEGHIRYTHIGEGSMTRLNAIQLLLAEPAP